MRARAEAQAVEAQKQARTYTVATSVNTTARTGTGCAETADTVRQACGGSEARMTWHTNVRPAGQ